MRLTVVGSGPAAPQPDTPASGLLVEAGETRVLVDCGLGVAGVLRRLIDPTTLSAVIIGHMHADHYADLAGLRYLFPWGERADPRLPVFLPPGGRDRIAALAMAISERVGFFDAAYEITEYGDGESLVLGGVRVTFVRSHHYVPAWSVVLESPTGRRLVYVGDTGPNPDLAGLARGADLLVCEATLASPADDTPDRGHLALSEALGIARDSGVPRLLVTHYPSDRRAVMAAEVALRIGGPAKVDLAVPMMTIDLDEGARPAVRGGGTGKRGDLSSRSIGGASGAFARRRQD